MFNTSFKELAEEMDFGYEEKDGNHVIKANDIDGNSVDWITFNTRTKDFEIEGNTDNLNLWFCDTRKDMDVSKIHYFVNELNGMTGYNHEPIKIQTLIDPEDWQEITGGKNPMEDPNYTQENIENLGGLKVKILWSEGKTYNTELYDNRICDVDEFHKLVEEKHVRELDELGYKKTKYQVFENGEKIYTGRIDIGDPADILNIFDRAIDFISWKVDNVGFMENNPEPSQLEDKQKELKKELAKWHNRKEKHQSKDKAPKKKAKTR